MHYVWFNSSLRASAKQSSEGIIPALDCFADARNDGVSSYVFDENEIEQAKAYLRSIDPHYRFYQLGN